MSEPFSARPKSEKERVQETQASTRSQTTTESENKFTRNKVKCGVGAGGGEWGELGTFPGARFF